ncbi:HTH-type transcriptional regulator ArgP [Oxalobacteraceae bacterium R-40]|uniref:HTH-type transcriptional regulator ArgP n=1 Tax=Keguizhuia sedimenti TaxID=3064264 RepID=A0ABU1BSK6_9BURK|nr:HTH-type transcriptional regulator ArgP [Oxalobacteraceae bacterium R-40]
MNLDPRQTDAFQAVAELGSFERAAAKLRLTPSAVSQRVRVLETTLGAALVLRSRPCRPTQTGQRLLQFLRRAQLLQADLEADLLHAEGTSLHVSVALNSDSLGTWFFPALASLLIKERIILDLIVEDQDHTYSLLESGMVAGCVSTVEKPMRGCSVAKLGTMRYRLMASASFRKRWFPKGLTREAARHAPVIAYTRKDMLQSSFLLSRLGLSEGAYPCHYVPGIEAHFAAVRHGLGYAMVPEWLLSSIDDERDPLVDLAQRHPTDVALYWHTWNVQAPRMERMSRQIVEATRKILS